MAKIFGLNGIIRGRQGNNVFSVQNGVQVLKVYQPAVANPKTYGQREQRSKFALAGKLSSATPSGAIVGMRGGNPRSRRAEFVSNILRNAITSLSGSNIVASVAFENILFAQGNIPVYSSAPTITGQWTGTANRANARISIPAMTNVAASAPAGYGEIYIAALFDAVSFNMEEVHYGIRSTTSANEETFRIGTRRDIRVAVYTVPFVPKDAVLAFRNSNLYDEETTVNVLGSLSTGVGLVDYGNSALLQVVPILGATTSMAPSPVDDMRGVVEDALMDTAVSETKRKK